MMNLERWQEINKPVRKISVLTQAPGVQLPMQKQSNVKNHDTSPKTANPISLAAKKKKMYIKSQAKGGTSAPHVRCAMMEVKGRKNFTGKSPQTSQGKNRFHKNSESSSSKTFPRKAVKEGSPKVTSKNFEKGATKPGKKAVKQFKKKPQGGKGPKDKFQKASERNRKWKSQPDDKRDDSAAKKLKWDDFKKKKKELKQSRQLTEKTNYDIVVRAKHIWESLRRKDCHREKQRKLMSDLQLI